MISRSKISPIDGEVGRFIVNSTSQKDESHIVDMSLNNGNGSCSCTDFSTRRYQNYKKYNRTILFGDSRTVCKHIIGVMNYEIESN